MENYSENMTDSEFLDWVEEIRKPFEGQLARMYIDVLIDRFERLRGAVRNIDQTKIGVEDNPVVTGYLCNKGAVDYAVELVGPDPLEMNYDDCNVCGKEEFEE